MKTLIAAFILILIYSSPAYADETCQSIFRDALYDSQLKTRLIGKIVIENKANGAITFDSVDNVQITLGRVIVPAQQWNYKLFEAVEWSPDGVCATAVNAIHIRKSFPDASDGRNIGIISILPRQMLTVDPHQHASYYDTSSSIYTSIQAGEGIFGGLITPFRGSSVHYNSGSELSEITIDILIPDPMPLWVEFENRFGGMITIKYNGKEPVKAGLVYRPVYGVGRFTGTAYCHVGRVRAVHGGVIDVSTSPMGEIGGFQIVPHFHADTTTVRNVRLLTQWMVVGPLDPEQRDYGLLSDLFTFIEPRFIELTTEIIQQNISPWISRFLVVAKFRDSDDWQVFPSLTDRVDDALEDLVAIRINFPDEDSFKAF